MFDTEGNNVTQETFEGAKLLFICNDVLQTSTSNMDEIHSLIKTLDGKIDMMLLTSSLEQEVETFRHENQLGIPYFFADATVLKTIVRANPGITLWSNGTVLGMWHHNDTPDADEIVELIEKSNGGKGKTTSNLK